MQLIGVVLWVLVMLWAVNELGEIDDEWKGKKR